MNLSLDLTMKQIRSNSFAKKEMRRTMLILITYFICCACFCQTKKVNSYGRSWSALTLETGSLIRLDMIEMTFSHSIGERWTVGFSGALTLSENRNRTEYTEHDNSFNTEIVSQEEEKTENIFKCHINAGFWAEKVYEGPYILICLGHDGKSKISHSVCIGYMCRIWKGLKFNVGYRTELLKAICNGDRSGCHMTTGLSYSF